MEAELDVSDHASRRSTKVATFAILAGLMWVAVRVDRRYNRWDDRLRAEISPLTRPRARAERMRVGYRDRRADVGDLVQLISAVMEEVGDARAKVNAPRR
jgi:hypothetical protein